MSDVADAIDAEAVPVTLQAPVAATQYDARGNAITPTPIPPRTIYAAMQPASGNQLRDLPEGIRSDVSFLGWSREAVAEGSGIVYRGRQLKVIQTWEWPEDGYTKFAMSERTG